MKLAGGFDLAKELDSSLGFHGQRLVHSFRALLAAKDLSNLSYFPKSSYDDQIPCCLSDRHLLI